MTKTTRITWTCEACGGDISDGAGIVGIPFREISSPDGERTWTALHSTCLPHSDYYGIDVAQVRGHHHLLTWTAHLLGKQWITESNWDDILRRAVA